MNNFTERTLVIGVSSTINLIVNYKKLSASTTPALVIGAEVTLKSTGAE